MKKCSIVRNVRLFDCLVVLVTVLSVRCATAGVFGIGPEGPRPVAKDGMRVYMGGNLNGMNEYFATYLYSWIYSTTELKHFKLFKTFGVAHSYDNAKGRNLCFFDLHRVSLGFTYCGKAGAEWTGFGLKVANLPADCDEVRLVWTGHSATVKRANLEAVSPGWGPYRDVGLRTLGGGKPFWNQLVLTSRLPSFERTVKKMENERDRSEFYDMLRSEIYAGVDRTFDESEAKCAAYACGPATFTLTIQPKGRDK